jgi:hypothetical protein
MSPTGRLSFGMRRSLSVEFASFRSLMATHPSSTTRCTCVTSIVADPNQAVNDVNFIDSSLPTRLAQPRNQQQLLLFYFCCNFYSMTG